MNKFFILLVLLSSSLLSAEEIVKIKQNILTIVKVQGPGEINNCSITIPDEAVVKITQGDSLYQLDRSGEFLALLRINNKNLDVSHCVSIKDKEIFYKKLLAKAAIEKRKGNPDFDNFLKVALDEATRFFLEN